MDRVFQLAQLVKYFVVEQEIWVHIRLHQNQLVSLPDGKNNHHRADAIGSIISQLSKKKNVDLFSL